MGGAVVYSLALLVRLAVSFQWLDFKAVYKKCLNALL
jgi:hypothetical protein